MTSKPVDLRIDPMEARFGVLSKALATCEQHGDYASITTRHSDKPSGCPVCAEAERAIRDAEDLREQQVRNAHARIERRLGDAMIPKRFQGKTFAQYGVASAKQRKTLDACVEYAEQFPANHEAGRCLLLLGRVGTGKTHLAAAIAHHVITAHGMTAVYRTVTGVLQLVKGSFHPDSDYSEAEAFSALIEPHLLVIDEAGATKQTEFELATLFTVINGRYEQQRPTILISNLMPDELPGVIGDRCVDRLREGGGRALVFDWPSARRGAA